MQSVTFLIPIRSGSKGLPGKNTRLLAGKPLYRHAVDLALKSGADRVIISTDIADVINSILPPKVEIIERPEYLCEDAVPMAPVLLHALRTGNVEGTVVLLQATSPLRQIRDVKEALKLLSSGCFDLVMSVTEADRSVLKWGCMQGDRFIPISAPEYCFSNRQNLPQVYKPNGAIYAMNANWFLRNGSFVSDRIGVFVMPEERSLDIDKLEDFERCEAHFLT